MRQPYMAICDAEAGYAEHLTEYMKHKKGFPFRIGTFTDVDTLLEFTRFSKVDLVLLAIEQYEEYEKKAKKKEYQKRCQMGQQTPIEHIVLLDHGQKELDYGKYRIYKYQSVETIMKELLYFLSTEDIAEQGKNQSIRTKLITFYTPVHRCLQTTTAFTYAKMLAQKERVLFLNLEAYSTLENLLQKEMQENLADLLYATKENNEKFGYKLAAMVMNCGNLDILPPMVNIEDLQSVTTEKWTELILQIKELHQYQKIVLDLGEPVKGFLDILSSSDRVIQLIREESSARQVVKQYDRMVEMLDYPYLEELTERYVLPDLVFHKESEQGSFENPLLRFIEMQLLREKQISSGNQSHQNMSEHSIIWEEKVS